MNEVTLLEKEQIFGEKKLDIFNKIGYSAKITDFAILLGGTVHKCYDVNNKEHNTGWYVTKTIIDYDSIFLINSYTRNGIYNYKYREEGIRPVVSYSKIKNDISNEIVNEDGVREIEYGEYPQQAVNKELQDKLEELYENNKLIKTNKTYTTDSRKYDEYFEHFLPQEHIEYKFDDKKYVRVKANINSLNRTLSNDIMYVDDDYVWVEVSKVKWLVDEKNDIVLSKDIIVAGIQFDNNKQDFVDNFNDTNMYRFLNIYFIKDIMPNKVNENTIKRDNTIKLFEEYKEALLRYNSAIKNLDTIKIKYEEVSEEYEDAKKAFEKIERNLPSLLEKEKNGKSKVKKFK